MRYKVVTVLLVVVGVGLLVSGQTQEAEVPAVNASSGRWLGLGLTGGLEQDFSIDGRYWFDPQYGLEVAAYYENWGNQRSEAIHYLYAMLGGLYRISDRPFADFYVLARISIKGYSRGEPGIALYAMGGVEWSWRNVPAIAFCIEYGFGRSGEGNFVMASGASVHYYFSTAAGSAD